MFQKPGLFYWKQSLPVVLLFLLDHCPHGTVTTTPTTEGTPHGAVSEGKVRPSFTSLLPLGELWEGMKSRVYLDEVGKLLE